MTERIRNVLILCTGNSARSIIGEALVNALGAGRFKGFSAGARPTGRVNPHALALLREKGHDVSGLRSKSWDEFTQPRAPVMDFVFTVCDSAAGEPCPVWPGAPVRAHWGLPDPAAVHGDEAAIRAAFEKAYAQLARRVEAFISLPLDELSPRELQHALRAIGELP